MRSRRIQIGVSLAIAASVAAIALYPHGGDDGSNVRASAAKQALRRLPYNFKFWPVNPPDGSEAAIAGTAYGPLGGRLDFGAAFGTAPDPILLSGVGKTTRLELDHVAITIGKLRLRDAGQPGAAGEPFSVEGGSDDAEMPIWIVNALCTVTSSEDCLEGDVASGTDEEAFGARPDAEFRTLDQGSRGP